MLGITRGEHPPLVDLDGPCAGLVQTGPQAPFVTKLVLVERERTEEGEQISFGDRWEDAHDLDLTQEELAGEPMGGVVLGIELLAVEQNGPGSDDEDDGLGLLGERRHRHDESRLTGGVGIEGRDRKRGGQGSESGYGVLSGAGVGLDRHAISRSR